jgi:hypothetical protein
MIYPVRILEWYGNSKNAFYSEKEMLEIILPYLKCENCGKPVTFKKGYVMHSITFGGPDEAWCCKKCLTKEAED